MHLHSKNASQIYLMNTYFEFWCQPCNNQGHLIVMMDILKQYIFRNILILINRSVWLVDEARMQKWSFGRNYCFPDNAENRFVILNPQNHIFPLFSAKTRLQQPLLVPPSSESLSPSSPALSHSKILTTKILPFISCLHFHQRETPLSLLCRVYYQILSRNTSEQTVIPALWIVLIPYCSTESGERNWKETERKLKAPEVQFRHPNTSFSL